MPSSVHALLERLRDAIGLVYREMIKFGVVGAIAFVIDIGGANVLWHTVLEDKVTTAKIISGVAATLFAWVVNRAWTFRHRRSRAPLQEVLLFFGVNAIALGIAAGVLALSHYGLGFQTRLADNVATVIGIGIGTIFRFVAYRYFVFAGVIPPEEDAMGTLATADESANVSPDGGRDTTRDETSEASTEATGRSTRTRR